MAGDVGSPIDVASELRDEYGVGSDYLIGYHLSLDHFLYTRGGGPHDLGDIGAIYSHCFLPSLAYYHPNDERSLCNRLT